MPSNREVIAMREAQKSMMECQVKKCKKEYDIINNDKMMMKFRKFYINCIDEYVAKKISIVQLKDKVKQFATKLYGDKKNLNLMECNLGKCLKELDTMIPIISKFAGVKYKKRELKTAQDYVDHMVDVVANLAVIPVLKIGSIKR